VSKHALFFTLKGETVKGLMERPSDREKVVTELVAGAGGKLEAYYWMFGQYDGFVIVEMPDAAAAAAVSMAVSSTGAFGHVETHELIPAGSLAGILQTAKGLTYSPPGAERGPGARW
jgi:uncharacterized protein with GYD domain